LNKTTKIKDFCRIGNKPISKKGQITIFIIIGIISLIFISAILWMDNQKTQTTSTQLDKKINYNVEGFQTYVESCIKQETEPSIKVLGLNGGTLDQLNSYKMYDGKRFRYLCTQGETNIDCQNIILTRQDLEIELEGYLEKKLKECINLGIFKKRGYKITSQSTQVDIKITTSGVIVTLNYPVTFEKKDEKTYFNEFIVDLDNPLSQLYELSNQIINHETIEGFFNKDEWLTQHNNIIKINKHKTYPDIVYSLVKEDKKTKEIYEFNFAIQGKNTINDYSIHTASNNNLGCCQNSYDNMCFANSLQSQCESKTETIYSKDITSCNCLNRTSFPESNLCKDKPCKNCDQTWNYNSQSYSNKQKDHGESWCVYDGPVGEGFDYVGSRHYKHSCIDGVEYVEEARDYREEICIDETKQGKSIAEIRINRWRSCFSQNNENSCLDTEKRDCAWKDALVNKKVPSYGLQRLDKGCFPISPPGFMHWKNNGYSVCSSANEWRYCDGYNCPDAWVDAVARLCYSMGDCGNFRNIADKITQSGYTNTDNIEREYLYLEDGLINKGHYYSLYIPLSNIKQAELTGDEFNNEGYTSQEMLEAQQTWYSDASTWNSETFSQTNKESPQGYIFASGTCNVWNAPASSRDCDICNNYKKKPCTEYKCKSLGQSCKYSEINGIGTCSSNGQIGTIETLEKIGLIPGTINLIIEPQTLEISSNQLSDNDAPEIIDYNILTENMNIETVEFNHIQGIKLDPAVYPFKTIKLEIKTDELSSLSLISPMKKVVPNINVYDINQPDNGFKNLHTLEINATPLSSQYEDLRNISMAWGFNGDIIKFIEKAEQYGFMNNFVTDDMRTATIIIESIEDENKYPLFLELNDNYENKKETVIIIEII
jgi:hypothetical protein